MMSQSRIRIEVLTSNRQLEPIVPILNQGLVDIYHYSAYQDTEESRRRLAEKVHRFLEQPEGLLTLGLVDNTIAGYCLVGPRSNELSDFTYPFIYALWIHPQWRGCLPVCLDLVRTTLRELKERGFSKVVAQVREQNLVWKIAVCRYDFEVFNRTLVRSL